jgi:hypothetical protein
VRLEVRRAEGERLDLLCFGSAGRTAIEFKYFTARWDGEDPDTGEQFHLRAHAADDVARRDFVFDIARLERLCANDRTLTNGFAVMLTNHQALWKPATRSQATRDQEFCSAPGLMETSKPGRNTSDARTEEVPRRPA